VGRALFEQAERIARGRGALRLMIEADPHAAPFYFRMGAVLCGQKPANVDGIARTLPLFTKSLVGPTFD
jgi:hypothetical protein